MDKKVLHWLFLAGFIAASFLYLVSTAFLSAETWLISSEKTTQQEAVFDVESALRCGNRDRALHLLEESFKRESAGVHGIDGLGMRSALLGDFDRARERFKKAAEMDPESPGLLVKSALVEEELNDERSALAQYDQASSLCEAGLGNTDLCIVALFCRAMLHLKEGEGEQAAADLERSRRLELKDVCLAELLKNADGQTRKKTCGEWIRPFLLQ
jgi:tetratricopeptide (TPR) repeat protein